MENLKSLDVCLRRCSSAECQEIPACNVTTPLPEGVARVPHCSRAVAHTGQYPSAGGIGTAIPRKIF
jgi:hypothetical protein